jgi:hypothetical protein
MLKKTLLTIISVLTVVSLVSIKKAQASSFQEDYNYQLTQYRKYHTEYQTLKEDSLENPTLDNQQRALQSAKQTIISRETTKIAYVDLLLDSIKSQKLTQDHILQTEKDLSATKKFYSNQMKLASNLATIEDLTNFTKKYLEDQAPYQTLIIKAQASRKLAFLIRIQINAKGAYDSLLPQISDQTLPPVSAGLEQITELANQVNQSLLNHTESIKKSEVTNYSKPNFYSKQEESLTQIKSLQTQLINILVDLEKNYVQ